MDTKVDIPLFNSYELKLPAWFAVPTHNFGNPKKPVWYSLANPTTNSRNLSHRSHMKSIDVRRMGIDEPEISYTGVWDDPRRRIANNMTLEHFDLQDQARIEKMKENPGATFGNHPALERGRPETMKKNIEYNRHHKQHTQEQKYGSNFLSEVSEVKKGKIIDNDKIQEVVNKSPSSSRTPSRLSELVSQLSSSKSSESMNRFRPKARGQSSRSSQSSRSLKQRPAIKGTRLIVKEPTKRAKGKADLNDFESSVSSDKPLEKVEPKKKKAPPKKKNNLIIVPDDYEFSSSEEEEEKKEVAAKKGRGRPKKYATAAEARTARIEKTKESNKRMKDKKQSTATATAAKPSEEEANVKESVPTGNPKLGMKGIEIKRRYVAPKENQVVGIVKRKKDGRVYYYNGFNEKSEAYGIVDGKVMIIGKVDNGSLDLFDEPKPVAKNIRFLGKRYAPIKPLNDLQEKVKGEGLTHTMPDGTIMTGSTHTSKSKPVKEVRVTKAKQTKIISRLKKEIKGGDDGEYLKEAIKQIEQIKGGSTAEQKGLASQLRTWIYPRNEKLYQDLSFIVHSGDREPHKYGFNKFADESNVFDNNAQNIIDQELENQTKNTKIKYRAKWLKGLPEKQRPPPPPKKTKKTKPPPPPAPATPPPPPPPKEKKTMEQRLGVKIVGKGPFFSKPKPKPKPETETEKTGRLMLTIPDKDEATIKEFVGKMPPTKKEPQQDAKIRENLLELKKQVNTKKPGEDAFQFQRRRKDLYKQIRELLDQIIIKTSDEIQLVKGDKRDTSDIARKYNLDY
jgi:hypothetical protein